MHHSFGKLTTNIGAQGSNLSIYVLKKYHKYNFEVIIILISIVVKTIFFWVQIS